MPEPAVERVVRHLRVERVVLILEPVTGPRAMEYGDDDVVVLMDHLNPPMRSELLIHQCRSSED